MTTLEYAIRVLADKRDSIKVNMRILRSRQTTDEVSKITIDTYIKDYEMKLLEVEQAILVLDGVEK